MHIQFWGAAQTVTGSMHLIEVGGRRILLDCGLYQGRRKEAFRINRDLPFDASKIHAVILSHAHIDHSGNLPSLIRAGYQGHIYATNATRDLCAHMLLDSAYIQENDVKYVNKKRIAKGQTPFEPLYTQPDAVETLKRFRTTGLHRSFGPAPGVRATFIGAGHILGAASVILDLEEGDRRKRLVFSGDIGRSNQPILRNPEIPEGADLLIMESTYGGRRHEASGEAKAQLKACIEDIQARGGKLLIPAFSVGRTQEIVYRLNLLSNAGELPKVPIFVDSPLAVNATEVFRLHPELFDDETRQILLTDPDGDILGFDRLRYTRDVAESIALNDMKGPAVIISASGMCEGGRILHHLRNHATDKRSHVMFVGYQAMHTTGRRILEGAKPIRIYGEEVEIKASVTKVNGYSAHADHDELLEWAAQTKDQGSLERTFLVHGEPKAAEKLSASLTEEGLSEVHMPERGEIHPI